MGVVSGIGHHLFFAQNGADMVFETGFGIKEHAVEHAGHEQKCPGGLYEPTGDIDDAVDVGFLREVQRSTKNETGGDYEECDNWKCDHISYLVMFLDLRTTCSHDFVIFIPKSAK